jgi:Protein of unknown function (DUF1706).
MNMKEHMLTALAEQLNKWEVLLSGLTEKEINTALTGSEWTLKDGMAHLMAWLQRSVAKLEAAQQKREPLYPQWAAGVKADTPEGDELMNAWLYEAHKHDAWEQVHLNWHDAYVRLLNLAQGFEERELLDSSRYPWLEGYSLADVLLGAYDHHAEHLDWVKRGIA